MKVVKSVLMLGSLLVMLSAAACSSSEGFKAVVNGKPVELSPKASTVMKDTVTDAVRHTMVFTNFELEPKMSKMKLQKASRKDGNVLVQLEVIGEKGTDTSSELKPGVYSARVGNTGSAFNSANGAKVAFGKDGQSSSVYLGGPDMKEGKIVISSVENGLVKGEVELQDGDNTLKGSFSATL